MTDISRLQKTFTEKYEGEATAGFFSPGRINLIGEHTDYNGGFVFPCAISFGNYCMIRKNDDGKIRLKSMNMPFEAELDLSELNQKVDQEWVNYVIGVFAQFLKKGIRFNHGIDMLFYGDVPAGAGLSSSAAIEVVTAVALNDTYQTGFDAPSLALMSQKAEHEFAGVQCGIMDQFASAMAKKDHAVFLNCDSLAFEQVPLRLDGYKILISNTNSPHKLDSGLYNQRVSECGNALQILRQSVDISNLAQLGNTEFESLQHTITDPVIRRRAKHVVTETERTKKAVNYLREGNLRAFGELMKASHLSLKHDYEVTGHELDTMFEEALKIEGVLGSRMTGGGFGGCTVSIVASDAVDDFIGNVGSGYLRKTGLEPSFYVAETSDGGKRIF